MGGIENPTQNKHLLLAGTFSGHHYCNWGGGDGVPSSTTLHPRKINISWYVVWPRNRSNKILPVNPPQSNTLNSATVVADYCWFLSRAWNCLVGCTTNLIGTKAYDCLGPKSTGLLKIYVATYTRTIWQMTTIYWFKRYQF